MRSSIFILATLAVATTFGRERAASEVRERATGGRAMAQCASPKASKELWFNNVRTIIYSGGDMWWDLNGNANAYYYVPAVTNRNTGVSSSFAGSIWLGGLDAGGQLKIAAMTYRQNGIDFWPGPLDTVNTAADPTQCLKYDEIFQVSRTEVENFVESGVRTAAINNWPGNGNVSLRQGRRLAPFVDVDFDGYYDPAAGDYPAYDIENKAEKDQLGFCKTKLYGDNTLFWVFNDNGGIHTETQGIPIGVEVRAQAFAFKTNDEINNMTFYSYEIYNRSSFQLNQTYFTIWNDADLGYYLDDYVGCDVKRGLGYIYNADPYDESISGVNGYLDYPPALGCDFFKGPLADVGDGIDNDADGSIDEAGETIQMSRFTYYNNNIGAFPPQTTNPAIAIHFYNYMTGKWKDGSNFTVGGNAYGGTQPAQFVYNGNPITGNGWTERGSGNLPGDRRFLQSAGPFTLKPGAVNEITFGMPWAQSPSKGGNIQSLELLLLADDKAQALFDNCFKLLDGPEAPQMTIQELPNELIFYLTNEKGKNNYKRFNNDYEEEDITIISDPTSSIDQLKNPDKKYRFEGYIVYQVKNDAVTTTELSDPTKAKVVFQCDVANGVTTLVNYELDNTTGGYVPKKKVDGSDKGIKTTFKITEDAFSTLENKKLVNNKEYHFICVAYAYNEYLKYAEDKSPANSPTENYLGQKRPYLEGRKYKKAAGTPHPVDFEQEGTSAQSYYGFGPKITRVEGQGNGGNLLTLTQASEDEIIANGFAQNVTYENARGPLTIKVVDPLNIKVADYRFRFINTSVKSSVPTVSNNLFVTSTSTSGVVSYTGTIGTLNVNKVSWELKDLTNNKTYYPNEIKSAADSVYQSISVGSEFYFPELGFSINVNQVTDPGEVKVNGFTNFTSLTADDGYAGPDNATLVDASMTYINGQTNWLSSIQDVDGETPFNWIRSGTNKTSGQEDAYYSLSSDNKIQAFYDPAKTFAKVLNGTWAPYSLVSSYYQLSSGASGNPARIYCGPGFSGNAWALDDYFINKFQSNASTKSSPDKGNTDLRKTSSILFVITRDRSKWSRCVVLEMQEKSTLAEGNALYFSPRNHKSVDKDGKIGDGVVTNNPDDADYIAANGMGWFPGYAINLETGERLNIAFGEDSYQKENNGNDMIWNPTSSRNTPYTYSMGGKHFVYVFGGNSIEGKFKASNVGAPAWQSLLRNMPYGFGRYDGGKRMIDVMSKFFTDEVLNNATKLTGPGIAPINAIERDIMWVTMPMVTSAGKFSHPDSMLSDVRVQINVTKPYRYGNAGMAYVDTTVDASSVNKVIAVNHPSLVTNFTRTAVSDGSYNYNFPQYTFNTSDIATLNNQNDVAKKALDIIRVVPNPYYGSSTYEARRTDNVVRIINLPNTCTIRIYSLNGTLIRTLNRGVAGQEELYENSGETRKSKRTNFVEWDLKNQNNISVASGLYIFHIDAPGIGEKIVKWFGVMRPLDVQSY